MRPAEPFHGRWQISESTRSKRKPQRFETPPLEFPRSINRTPLSFH